MVEWHLQYELHTPALILDRLFDIVLAAQKERVKNKKEREYAPASTFNEDIQAKKFREFFAGLTQPYPHQSRTDGCFRT